MGRERERGKIRELEDGKVVGRGSGGRELVEREIGCMSGEEDGREDMGG